MKDYRYPEEIKQDHFDRMLRQMVVQRKLIEKLVEDVGKGGKDGTLSDVERP